MPAKAAAVRREYQAVKRLYHTVGKKVFGSPKNAPIRKEYAAVKREYHRVGKQLAKITKKR